MVAFFKVITAILSDGYGAFRTGDSKRLASILTDGYYPLCADEVGGGGAATGGDEDREFRELMDVLYLVGAI